MNAATQLHLLVMFVILSSAGSREKGPTFNTAHLYYIELVVGGKARIKIKQDRSSWCVLEPEHIAVDGYWSGQLS